ncbi:FAD binding domain-containing protein [Mycena rosella]|uniref:FAD binding domain-containing protein n=1 Tax=Mycena rosella TaxID=1033263 RepID=A0AAD7G246_MYCRO|nr:FAD binding domain-containing protein [Mycena rosella]
MIGYERHDGGIIRSAPSSNVIIPARFKYEFTAATETIEGILRESMDNNGCHISYRTTPIHMDLCDDPKSNSKPEDKLVKVVLQHLPADFRGSVLPTLPKTANGLNTEIRETVFAKYVIGADGAHSWVRRYFNIPMEGDQTEDFWGAADVEVDTNYPDFRCKSIIQATSGAIIIIPREDNTIRIYVQLPSCEAPRTADGRFDRSVSTEQAFKIISEKAKAGFMPYKFEFTHLFWCTVFGVSQMVAAKYSVQDKIFIVGDACHTHSPKAGQGANASMGDAHNLAWKLAHVVRKWADPSLLRTYEDERRGYAQELIELDKTISVALDGGTAAQYKSLIHKQNMFTSGIGIKYHSSLINGTELPMDPTNLQAGYRLPTAAIDRLTDWLPADLQDLAPSDGLFKLILFPGDSLVAADAKRLQDFSDALAESPDTTNLLETRVTIHTILNSDKQRVLWSDVPSILRDWRRVFVAKEMSDANVYCIFGISTEGAAVLVRPDGHMSLVTTMGETSARKIINFLMHL